MIDKKIVLECNHLYYGYHTSHTVLHDINFKILRGQIIALVGPSGSGKTTLLKLLLGTHHPRQGEVIVHTLNRNGIQSTKVTSPGRDRGIVYQKYSLLPHMTSLENVAFGLRLKEIPLWHRLKFTKRAKVIKQEILDKSAHMLDKLGIGYAKDLYPYQLSGGMCQRVAIAQALILKPAILLLDEPFGALDELTREELQRMLLTLYSENMDALAQNKSPPYTIFIVTHELNEAIFVGDRIIGLSPFWNWQEKGFNQFPGSAIVYDQSAPVFEAHEEFNINNFKQLKSEILSVAFDQKNMKNKETYLNFWSVFGESPKAGVFKYYN